MKLDLTKIRLERDRKPKEDNDIEEIKKILLKNPSPRSFHVNLSNTEQTDISEAVYSIQEQRYVENILIHFLKLVNH